MGDFFHGWRRKAGCVTLLLACVLLAGWIKSIWLQDDIEFRLPGGRFLHTIHSVGQSVTWACHVSRGIHPVPFSWQSGPPSGAFPDQPVVIDWQWNGIAVGNVRWEMTSDYIHFWRFPHLSVGIPLTLLSAYLILWKPRKAGVGQKREPSAAKTAKQSSTEIR